MAQLRYGLWCCSLCLCLLPISAGWSQLCEEVMALRSNVTAVLPFVVQFGHLYEARQSLSGWVAANNMPVWSNYEAEEMMHLQKSAKKCVHRSLLGSFEYLPWDAPFGKAEVRSVVCSFVSTTIPAPCALADSCFRFLTINTLQDFLRGLGKGCHKLYQHVFPLWLATQPYATVRWSDLVACDHQLPGPWRMKIDLAAPSHAPPAFRCLVLWGSGTRPSQSVHLDTGRWKTAGFFCCSRWTMIQSPTEL